jgi:hypothetical protein
VLVVVRSVTLTTFSPKETMQKREWRGGRGGDDCFASPAPSEVGGGEGGCSLRNISQKISTELMVS